MLFGAYYPGRGGVGGTPDVQQTGIIKWAAKIKKTKKIPQAFNKTQKNPWTKT